jgi:hypothetical protein
MLSVKAIDIRLFNMRTRLPFRYGMVTLRACPHLFLKLTLEIDGQRVSGTAADHLPPKWFTKDPNTSYENDLKDMIALVRSASDYAVLAGAKADVYSLISEVYQSQSIWGREKNFLPLLYNHGVSLVERACIEAFCRAKSTTFAKALRENLLGIRFSGFADQCLMLDYQDLGDTQPAHWLPKAPLRQVIARHTVGLVDALTDAEIPAADRVNDGLPQSLESCIKYYGLAHFKLKIAGDVEKDLDRLKRIFGVITQNVSDQDWRFTIDGNENYQQIGPFRQLWHSLQSDNTLQSPLSHLLFIEQPLHRDVALSEGVRSEMTSWLDRPPIIIDESDDQPGALARALACGYVGTSHKNCKGVIKSIANACLLEKYRQENPRQTYLLSGEDLSNVGPVALLQDLAVAASLGIESLERNGHHYFKGLSMHAPALQEQVLKHHPDIYRRHQAGFATLNITGGNIDIGSAIEAPLGVGFELDLTPFTPLKDWEVTDFRA